MDQTSFNRKRIIPLVSIIVPVYQAKDYLIECIDSIISQTYHNLEIIIVDDGSTDGSAQICDDYIERDFRIKVIHKENGGLSDARNVGIAVANGKYVTFVDSDDIIGADMITIMTETAEKEMADIVKVLLIRVKDSEELKPTVSDYEVITSISALKRIYHDSPQIISGCGKLFLKTLFDTIRFPVGMYYEDEFTIPKLYYCAKKIVFCNSIQYFYMQRENNSIMRSPFTDKKCWDSIRVVNDRIDFFHKIGDRSLENVAIKDYYYKLEYLLGQSSLSNDTRKELLNRMENFQKKYPFLYLQIIIKVFFSKLKNSIKKMIKRFN